MSCTVEDELTAYLDGELSVVESASRGCGTGAATLPFRILRRFAWD